MEKIIVTILDLRNKKFKNNFSIFDDNSKFLSILWFTHFEKSTNIKKRYWGKMYRITECAEQIRIFIILWLFLSKKKLIFF